MALISTGAVSEPPAQQERLSLAPSRTSPNSGKKPDKNATDGGGGRSVVRKVFLAFRLLVLLAVLAGAYLLFHMARSGDPRFFWFLTTRPGRELAKLLRWNAVFQTQEIPNKPDAELTEAERAVKAALANDVAQGVPTHRLIFSTGKVMTGKIVRETSDFIVFRESYGHSGSLDVNVAKTRISTIEILDPAAPEITYSDILFKQEFAAMKLYKRMPYTFVTDDSYFQVEHAIRALGEMYAGFSKTFAPLIRKPLTKGGAQVLFFSREEQFKTYQDRYAPHLASAAGFYSPALDRLVIYNQLSSTNFAVVRHEISSMSSGYRNGSASASERGAIRVWEQDQGRVLSGIAEQQTMSVVRHEGAHQLFHACGVHSPYRTEGNWLLEGLACYCETAHIGDKDPWRTEALRNAAKTKKLIPLDKLVNSRSYNGLAGAAGAEQVELAYNQSWALVHMLMQPEHREKFFGYIRHLREPTKLQEIASQPGLKVLCATMGVAQQELEKQYLAYLKTL